MISAAKAPANMLIRRVMTVPLPLLHRTLVEDTGPNPPGQGVTNASRIAFRVIFIGTKRPPLETIADWIGGQLCLLGHGLFPKVLGTASRTVTKPPGVAVIPPSGRVIGRAVENLEMDARMLKSNPNELNEV